MGCVININFVVTLKLILALLGYSLGSVCSYVNFTYSSKKEAKTAINNIVVIHLKY